MLISTDCSYPSNADTHKKPPDDHFTNSVVTREAHSTTLGALGQDTSTENCFHYQSHGQVTVSAFSHDSADLAHHLAPPQIGHRPHRPWICTKACQLDPKMTLSWEKATLLEEGHSEWKRLPLWRRDTLREKGSSYRREKSGK